MKDHYITVTRIQLQPARSCDQVRMYYSALSSHLFLYNYHGDQTSRDAADIFRVKSTLTIAPVEYGDRAHYSCSAVSAIGATRRSALFRVRGRLTLEPAPLIIY